ncbi:DUF1415 domain-containing protein [Thiomicrorhabdus sp. ZW0627]|uniref:DUF1415 domain-containing protein n=1 Tax=Thiomicrorhabdus sp. ZW0627 TaxID=3039774 RepID=UPI0024372C81|nr:DUF1415 domain-containing protein [Thiomicrorhabdus sp. ZW0627]MDG6773434.1 DUF1415 domain-containing protein [Thiomicrorhabdus sp. ZW0627]
MLINQSDVELQIRNWLQQVVIGLNLCPFASKPYLDNQVRIAVSDCTDDACLLEDLLGELQYLDGHKPQEVETTLIVIPGMLEDFYDYNDFLDSAEALLGDGGWAGTYQIASFHPHYQFAGTQPEDSENLTNRAPYPVLHLIREASLEKALKHYPNPEMIPERNIETVEKLTDEQKHNLFPFLFK